MNLILYSGWYNVALCKRRSDLTFVFGDNLLGFGMGGQAIIRGEPNAFGIPTKRKPAMTPGSFFEEGNEDDLDAVLVALNKVWEKLKAGETIVFPITTTGRISLGLERAELLDRAPSIYDTITHHVKEMGDAYGCEVVDGL